MRRSSMVVLSLSALLLLSACEKSQTAGTAKKADGKPWESQNTGFDATGYKPGNRDAWEAQLRTRNAGQNEYAKTR